MTAVRGQRGAVLADHRAHLLAELVARPVGQELLDGLDERRLVPQPQLASYHPDVKAYEVFDAAADRYEEFFFLAGLGFYFRNAPLSLGLVLLTVLGSFMVSYGTAKAEALQVESPRGSMRRAERALYLGAGALLAPIAYALTVRFALPSWAPEAPILAALSVVGMVSNVSAVTRLQAVAAAVRRREGAAEALPLPTPGVDPEVDAIRSTAR